MILLLFIIYIFGFMFHFIQLMMNVKLNGSGLYYSGNISCWLEKQIIIPGFWGQLAFLLNCIFWPISLPILSLNI